MIHFMFPFALAATPPLDMGQASFSLKREEICLPSGLRVLYHHEPSHPTVYWTTIVDVGSQAEPPGQEGLAHLVEHLWFDTTPFRAVTAKVSSNASTNPDTTIYYALGADRQLPELIEAESERFGVPLHGVTEAILEREKDIVEAERRWRYENNAFSGYAMLPIMVGDGHPYVRPTIGSAKSIASLTLSQARTFWNTHVTPDRTSWIVTGPRTATEFRELLQAHGATEIWTPSPSASCQPKPRGPIPDIQRPIETQFVQLEAAVSYPHAVIAWTLPPAFGSDHVQQERAIRMVDSVGDWNCRHVALRLASLAVCEMNLWTGGNSEPFAIQVQQQLDKVHWTWDSSDRRLQKHFFRIAHTNTLTDLFTDLELTSAQHTDARLWHHTGALDGSIQALRAAGPVKLGADNEVLARWFDQKTATVAIVTPRKGIEKLAEMRTHDTERSDLGAAEEPTVERIRKTYVAVDPNEISVRTLDNGLEVWAIHFGASPFVRSRLVFAGGEATAPDIATDKLFWTLISTDSIVQNMPIYQAPLVIGGDWYHWRGGRRTEIGISSVKGRVGSQLYLLRTRMDNSRLDFDRRLSGLDEIAAEVRGGTRSAEFWARYHRDVALTGTSSWWTPEMVAHAREIKKSDLKAWKTQVIRPQGSRLVIVGDVDPRQAVGDAYRWLGDWKGSNKEPLEDRKHVRTDVPSSTTVFDDGRRTDAVLHVACPRLGATPPAVEAVARNTLRSIVDGQLRETWGATYTVGAWLDLRNDESAIWNVNVEVPSQAVGPTIQTLRAVFARLAEGRLPETFVDLRKLEWARTTRFDMRDPSQVLDRVLAVARRSEGLDALSRELDDVLALNPATVGAQFAQCTGHEVITVVGPENAIRVSLEDADVAYDAVDWKVQRQQWLRALK